MSVAKAHSLFLNPRTKSLLFTSVVPRSRKSKLHRSGFREVHRYFIATILLLSACFTTTQVSSPLYTKEVSELFVETEDGATSILRIVAVESNEDRARGLMHVRFLPLDQGMLFVYESDRNIGMWMKNTQISLDMWFLSSTGTVLKVVRNTTPYSEETIWSDRLSRAVLEVNAGLSSVLGVREGTRVVHEKLPKSLPHDDR